MTDKPVALGFQLELEFGNVGFCGGRKTGEPGKSPRSRDENQQQTQPTYDVKSGNRTRATLVGGTCSHHCAILAPLLLFGQRCFEMTFLHLLPCRSLDKTKILALISHFALLFNNRLNGVVFKLVICHVTIIITIIITQSETNPNQSLFRLTFFFLRFAPSACCAALCTC